MSCLRNQFFVTAFLIVFLAGLSVSGAEEKVTGQKAYVDLDGDGFDDNTDDTDGDGIPDRFEKRVPAPRAVAAAPRGDIFAALKKSSPVLRFSLSPLESFTLRQFTCRAQSKCRSDFESEFTAGLGISSGSSGGHCVGGVCF